MRIQIEIVDIPPSLSNDTTVIRVLSITRQYCIEKAKSIHLIFDIEGSVLYWNSGIFKTKSTFFWKLVQAPNLADFVNFSPRQAHRFKYCQLSSTVASVPR